MSYSINPPRNFRARISSACRRLCNTAPFAGAALALVVLAASAQAQSTTDYDTDDDNLIEVSNLEQLNAIRYDLNGDGDPDNDTNYFAAFTGTGTSLSCHTACTGYELTADLDFDTNGSGATHTSGTGDSGDDYYNSGSGWDPIGLFDSTEDDRHPYTATFEGNRHTISNLFISRSTGGDDNQGFGLFAYTSSTSEIRNVGLVNVHVTGRANTGSLIGRGEGRVYASWATGSVTGTGTVGGLVAHTRSTSVIAASYSAVNVTATSNLGGLVGLHVGGDIIASYATGTVHCSTSSCASARGGLVGSHREATASVVASYSTGAVTPTGTDAGGLIGDISRGGTEDSVTNSYWDTATSGIAASSGSNGTGQTTSALQTPTGYTSIYQNWNVDVDGVSGNDSPWDFGTTSQYPVLKVNFGGVTTIFGPQREPGVPTVTAVLTEGATAGDPDIITVTITRSTDGGDPASYQYRYNTDGSTWNPDWTTVSGTTFQISSTTLETQYNIEVRAVNAASTGEAATFTAIPADTSRDYDTDDDGLIEVTNLEQLNAIRYDLDGDGAVTDAAGTSGVNEATAYATGMGCPLADHDDDSNTPDQPVCATGMGCPLADHDDDSNTPDQPVCTGYELTADLDFDENGDGARNDTYNMGSGWDPFGADGADTVPFTATFEGNGHTITGLFINLSTTATDANEFNGLFGEIGPSALIERLGLEGVNITSGSRTGGLVGDNQGTIRWVYVTGSVTGAQEVGGLVGKHQGHIAASWSTADVTGDEGVGGLVGGQLSDNSDNNEEISTKVYRSDASITASYFAGTVTGQDVGGGLVGYHRGTVSASYSRGSVDVTGPNDGAGGLTHKIELDIGFDLGVFRGLFEDTYWDRTVSGLVFGIGEDDDDGDNTVDTDETNTHAEEGKTTSELQAPTGYTGIYSEWNVDVDGDGNNDDPWDFGTNAKYPCLKADFDGNGTATAAEFGDQTLPPTAPQNLLLTTPVRRSITASWAPPEQRGSPPLTGYVVRACADGQSGSQCEELTHASDYRTTTFTSLTGGVTYTVTIAATYIDGDGQPQEGPSASAMVTLVADTPPGPPGNLRLMAGNQQITVRWIAPSELGDPPLTGYTVQACPPGASGAQCHDRTVASDILTHTFTGLTNGVTYTVKVWSLTGVGVNQGPADTGMATPIAPTSTPGDGGGGGGGGDGGGGGGSGGGRPRDLHGNTPAQATPLAFSPATPRRATRAGQISPAGDRDYFTVEVPRAGLLIVETTGRTDTAGTVWQHDEELATATQGGERRNFRLSSPVEAGPVVLAVRGNGNRTGAYTLVVRLVVGFFENPRPGSAQSGIGVLSGWVCEAEEVMLEFVRPNGHLWTVPAATGTTRPDTEAECGDTDNGFGLLWNWNRLGPGMHTVRALVDGEVWAEHALSVTTLGLTDASGHETDFPRGLSGTYTVADFPDAGTTTTLEWQQALQNFVIVSNEQTEDASGDAGAQHTPETARLENPSPGSSQSGIGVISGWKCDCEEGVIEVQFEHGTTGETQTVTAGYGTMRPDTDEPCGDTDNGFGLLWNWNRLGEGEHLVRVFADGEEFAWSRVVVTTLGEEFARGLEGTATLADFPVEGQAVTVEWQQALQNFTITGRQEGR